MWSLLAATAAVSRAQFSPQAYPNLCGTFGDLSECRPMASQSVQETVELSGITSGNYVMTQKTYKSADCDGSTLMSQLFAEGTWQDLGPLVPGGTTNQRKLTVTVATWQITPQDPDFTTMLNDPSNGCPCGGTWAAGQMRVLKSCTQGSCPNLGIFGSSLEEQKAGIAIGKPAFTVAVKNDTAFYLGRYDMLPSDGFNNGVDNIEAEPPQFISPAANGTACPTPTFPGTYCGAYTQQCSPEVDLDGDAVEQSFRSTFQYCGGQADVSFDSGSAGWFNRTYTLYSDTICSTPKISFEEVGTMMSGKLSNTGEESYEFNRFAGAVTATAYGDQVLTLNLQCPCGGQWEDGVPRRLTQCMTADGGDSSCPNQGWYQNVTIGQKVYGVVRRSADGQDLDELQFSKPSEDQDAAPNMYLDGLGGLAYQLDNKEASCPYDTPSYEFCGTWSLQCTSAENAGDMTNMILMTGEGDDDGQILMYKQYFNPGTGCDETMGVQLTIEATGYYSKIEVQDTHPGVLINFPNITVTATNEGDMVTALNDPQFGCPCDGTWVANQARKLTSCPTGSCPGKKLFGAGTLQKPGYGLMQVVGGKLQMNMLDETEDNIYPNGRYDMSAFPFELDAQCEPAQYDPEICGTFYQPCQSDGAITDFTLDYTYNNFNPDTYSMTRNDYAPGSGCDDSPILTVTQSGKITEYPNTVTAVDKGRAVELEPASMTITPANADIASRLMTACPCGVTWQAGQPQTFTAGCPANTCPDDSWLRQPIGVKSYGSMRKVGTALRMTSFNADMTLGYQNDLQPYDYALTVIDTDTCDPNKKPPSGKKSQAKKSTSGGDIFVILFFVATACYLIGGMILNQQRIGQPRIPNIEFWKQIPGLVVDGINFSVCQLCGTRGGSTRSYAEFGGNPDNTYGSL